MPSLQDAAGWQAEALGPLKGGTVLPRAEACGWASDPEGPCPPPAPSYGQNRRLAGSSPLARPPGASAILEREKDLPCHSCSARGGGSLPAGWQGTLTQQDLLALNRVPRPRLPQQGLTLMADCPWVQGHFSAAGLEFVAELEARGQVLRVCTPSLGGMHGLTLLDEGSANMGFLHLQER